jgi:hypothetical protein
MVKRIFLSLLIILSVTLLGCEFIPDVEEYQSKSKLEGPSAGQIKADLIGQRIILDGQTWEFAALSEFEQFEIKGENEQGNAIEYDVSMRLKDFVSDTQFYVELFIVYKDIDGKWELVSIVTKVFERVGNGQTF